MRENVTVAGGQFLLRAEVVEFRHGDLLAGRYQIEKAIGRGATGTVVQAFDRVVRSVVAVKILRPDLSADERWVERLGGELRYARKLQHRNVCRVFDLGVADGHHFLTMEFAGGGSLRQRLADGSPRSWETRIDDARAVIDGLVAIHEANIVHRDVKPENVLVMDDGRLVVSDFGVAVSAGHTTYFSSKVAGTPSYMAPEVIMGEKATPRADVFSLGIVLHEILFGRRPDWQMTPKGRVLKSPVGRKATKREKAFASICAECLKEYAPDRLADAAEVKRRFELAVAGRLKPLRRRLRERWPLLVGAVAVAASAMMVTARSRRAENPPAARSPVAKLSGSPIDLAAASRAVFSTERPIRCLDLLPGGRSVRLVRTKPVDAIDVDLTTGDIMPSTLAPETMAVGCPRLSPDGRRLLYTRADASKRSQIYLSESGDGAGGEAITEGESPVWFPSSDEFVYTLDKRRASIFSLPNKRLLYPDSPPLDRFLISKTINEAGDRVALLLVDTGGQATVEIYDHPAMKLVQRTPLAHRAVELHFDKRRHSLQTFVTDPRNVILAELSPGNDLVRIGAIPDTNVLSAVRSQLGLAFMTTKLSHSIELRSPEGTVRTIPFAGGYGRPSVSHQGDALVETRLADGRLVLALRRWQDAELQPVTAGPDDAYGALASDGQSFVHVRLGDDSLVACRLGPPVACRTVTKDSLGPRHPVLSPDGKLVAYTTAHGANSRLRTVPFMGGASRELGMFRSKCGPVWASNASLWTYQADKSIWTEIDAHTGQPAGRTRPHVEKSADPCDRPPPLEESDPPRFQLQRIQKQSLEVRLARDL